MKLWQEQGICSSRHPSAHLPRAALDGSWADGILTSREFLPPLTNIASTLVVQRGTPSVQVESDGAKVIKGKDLKGVTDILSVAQDGVTALTIWTPRAALRAGMLLRDSLVAKQVRDIVLDLVEAVPNPQLTQIQILAQIVNSMAQNEQRQIANEQQIMEQNRRIAELEQTRAAALAELTAIPVSTNPPAALSVRAKINMLVRNYCDRYCVPHNNIWNSLYKEMYYRYRYSVEARCKKSGKKKLDQIEADDRLNDLYDLASLILALDRSLQASQ